MQNDKTAHPTQNIHKMCLCVCLHAYFLVSRFEQRIQRNLSVFIHLQK